MTEAPDALREAVLREALDGLSATPKTLAPWLFYDERGSQLFEQITELPEYYLTRTERALFAAHCDEILALAAGGHRLTLLELGAGSAAKTGLLLRSAAARQDSVLYQPIDVSAAALAEAERSIACNLPSVQFAAQTANYTTEPFRVTRAPGDRVLALYIGSSIGNFSDAEATAILRNLHAHLAPGDALLLGVDLAPGDHKPVAALLDAYDDAQSVTAAFNLNILARLNRELDADFDLDAFAHRARWNAAESRIEMHLESLAAQIVHVAGERFTFAAGETIHTENSRKFTAASLAQLLAGAAFEPVKTWSDPDSLFAVTLARVEDVGVDDTAI